MNTEDTAWLRQHRGEFTVERCAHATTEPHRLTYDRFVADVLLRGDDLILQLHLPFPLKPRQEPPAWWLTTFPETLSDVALRFFTPERKEDLRAVHSTLGQPHSTAVINSWYFEARRERFFTTAPEASAIAFLDQLQEELRQRLAQGTPSP